MAADLAAKAIAAEIEALKSADALIIAERGRCAKSMSPLQVVNTG